MNKGRSSSLALNQELQQSLGLHLGCGVINNSGYLPSRENPSDDPTRHVEIRKPAEPLPDFFLENDPSEESEQLRQLDAWLVERGADPWTVAGLPDLQELGMPSQEDPSWSKKHRRKRARRRRAMACSGFSCREGCEASKESGTDGGVDQLHRNSFFFPTARSKGRPALTARARAVLQRVRRDQFIFPASWHVPDGWVPDFAGYLDLYSGAKGVARSVAAKGDVWCICFEIEDSPFQDVLADDNKEIIQELLPSGAINGFGAAIFCSSFSRAVRPPFRSAACCQVCLQRTVGR